MAVVVSMVYRSKHDRVCLIENMFRRHGMYGTCGFDFVPFETFGYLYDQKSVSPARQLSPNIEFARCNTIRTRKLNFLNFQNQVFVTFRSSPLSGGTFGKRALLLFANVCATGGVKTNKNIGSPQDSTPCKMQGVRKSVTSKSTRT